VPNLLGEIGEPTWWHNELDYVAPEVTVRYFTATPAPRRVEVGQGRVEHVGDDVTVRSVTPKHATVPPALSAGSATQPVDP
jgi:hypothetical protein